jgi:hypothetical protein
MLPASPLFHKPKSIIAAMNILYATMFLGIINWVVDQMTRDLATRFLVRGIITVLVALSIMFILIKQIGLGRKWARVVLLVLFILGILLYPWTIVPILKGNLLVGVIGIFQTLLQIVALVFLFSKDSTQWFNHVHASAQEGIVPDAGGRH